jgi:hypothetical protein
MVIDAGNSGLDKGGRMDLNAFRGRVRGTMMTGQQALIRGGSAAVGAPKKSFGAKLAGVSTASVGGLAGGAAVAGAASRARLDSLHAQIRVTTDTARLCDLVDEYVMVAATVAAEAQGVGGLIPGGSILAAAVSAIGGTGSSGGRVQSTAQG